MSDKPFSLNGKKQQKISNTIVVDSARRDNPDIKAWRDALKSAEDPYYSDRSSLYDIYEETILDGMVTSVTERIYLKCANSKIIFEKDGQADKEHPLSDIVQTPIFLDVIRWIVESKWFGHSLIEFDIKDQGIQSAELIPRKNVIPKKGIVTKNVGEQQGITYRMPPYENYILEIGKQDDLGLLNKAAPYAIYKRFGLSAWGEFAERFGIPITEYNYDPQIPNSKQEVEEQARKQGAGAIVIMPTGTTTKIHQGANASGSAVFKDYKEANDDEIILIFLLQTMTTKNGSSRSQAEVHQGGEDELIAGYKLFVEMVLNFQLKPLLAKHGFDTEGGVFKYEDTEKLSKKEILDMIKGLSQFGDVSLDYIEKHFGIKLTPKEKTEMAAEQLQYKKKSRYDLDCSCTPLEQEQELLTLSFSEQEENDLLERIYNIKGKAKFDSPYFEELASGLVQQMNAAWKNPNNIDYNAPDHLSKTLLELNLYRFSATKDMALTAELNEKLRAVDSFAAFEQEAADILTKYNKSYLATEYNLAKTTAQTSANYLRNMEVAEEFPYWEYQTVGDDNVRPAHAALDGQYFLAGEVGALAVPNGYNCRCEFIPRDSTKGKKVLTEDDGIKLLGTDYDDMKKTGFATNRAEQAFVFDESQMYVDNFAERSLSYSDFGLAAYTTIKKNAAKAITTKRSQAEASNWFSRQLGVNDNTATDKIRLLDYNKRPIALTEKTLLNNKDWQLLDLLPEAIANPDEVYFERTKKGYLIRSIKYYNPKPLVVEIFIDTKESMVQSWSFAKNIGQARTGLLIKK